MLRAGLLRPSRVCLGIFDPVYDRNQGGAHKKRRDALPTMGNSRVRERKWNPNAVKYSLRKVPYTNSSIAEMLNDAEEAVAGVHRDHLEPRQRRYVNRIGLGLALICVMLYSFTIWRFGQEVFDDVVIPEFSDSSGKGENPQAK